MIYNMSVCVYVYSNSLLYMIVSLEENVRVVIPVTFWGVIKYLSLQRPPYRNNSGGWASYIRGKLLTVVILRRAHHVICRRMWLIYKWTDIDQALSARVKPMRFSLIQSRASHSIAARDVNKCNMTSTGKWNHLSSGSRWRYYLSAVRCNMMISRWSQAWEMCEFRQEFVKI